MPSAIADTASSWFSAAACWWTSWAATCWRVGGRGRGGVRRPGAERGAGPDGWDVERTGQAAGQDVGDGQQAGAGGQEQAAVQGGQPQPHGAPRQPGRRPRRSGRTGSSGVPSDPITGLGHGGDDRRVAEFGAQPADRQLDGVVNGSAASSQARSSSSSAETPVPGFEQQLQHARTPWGRARAAARRGWPRGGRVQPQVPVARTGGSGGPCPAGQSADAGDEFGEGEGLGQVVVGAQAQAVDPVLDRGRGGQHQDPGWRPAATSSADLVAVDPGQVAVQHDHVVPVTAVVSRASLPSGRRHGHALATQPGRDRCASLA